jgi:lactococcin 972 family bacteriocin
MSGRCKFVAVLVLAVCALMLLMSAAAFAESGSALLSNTRVTPFAQVSVGGGTWNYGTGWIDMANIKYCWSDYYHKTKLHSATAKLGPFSSGRIYASAGKWANAYVQEYDGYDTGTAYWNTY